MDTFDLDKEERPQSEGGISELDAPDLQAIRMKYLGNTSQEIAEALGLDDSVVRRLFMKGGRLEKEYREFALKMNQASDEELKKMIKEQLKDEALPALLRIVKLSRTAKQERQQLDANIFILDQAGVSKDASLEELIKSMGRDRAKEAVNQIWEKLWGAPFQLSIVIENTGIEPASRDNGINTNA